MARVLLLFALTASAPSTELTIPKTIISTMTTLETESGIAAATRRNGRIFAIYIGVLIISALVIAFLTWLTWDSGNKVQEAIQVEANARIEEARAVAAQANQKAEEERLARVKIEERLAGRQISPEKRDEMVSILKQVPGSVAISGLASVDESKTYAITIAEIFRQAGWQTVFALVPPGPNPPVGVVCKADASKIAGRALKIALTRLPGATVVPAQYNESPPDHAGVIIVGLRTPPSN